MRNNIPTDDLTALLPVTDEGTPAEKLTPEQKTLAKIGASPQWKIIQDYIDQRIESYKIGLFGEDLAGKSTSVIGERFLAAMSVIQEFERLKSEINTTTEAVREASSEK